MEIFPFPFLSSDNFQALRSTNFSRESFVSREPFSSSDFQVSLWWAELWYEVWVVDLWCEAGEAVRPNIDICQNICFAAYFRHRFPINGTTFIKICRKRDCAKKVAGQYEATFSIFKEEKDEMMEQTLRSFVFLLAPSQEHMFGKKLIKHWGSDKVSFHNHFFLNFCKQELFF